jgi:protein-tyrosine phosphatase
MMRQFEPGHEVVPDVPDPYYSGPDGFGDAYQMLCENADRLLDYLEKQPG